MDLIGAAEWSDLVNLAADVRSETQHELKQMTRQQDDWRRMNETLESLRGDISELWKRLDTFDDWPNLRHGFIEDLVNAGMERGRATDVIDEFGRSTARDVIRNLQKPIDAWALELDDCSIGRFAALAAADLSDAVGRFHRYAASTQPDNAALPEASGVFIEQLRDLYVSLTTASVHDLETLAKRIEHAVAEAIDPFLHVAARVAREIETSDDPARGRLGIEAADGIRLGLLVRSVARVVVWTAGWGEHSEVLLSWREAAREKTFESSFRPAHSKQIKQFLASPPAEGEAVSVEGWIGPVTIVHHGRKALSTAHVTDRRGHALQVGLPYIKLDSGGLVEGSYARLSGAFYQQHHDFEGPVFVPARRSLTQDSRHSWQDWVALRLMSAATPVPHNLCASWSWVLGSNGAANPLRYGTWASTRKGMH